MKLLLLLSTITTVTAGINRPSLTINVSDGSFTSISSSISPTISQSSSFDLPAGFTASTAVSIAPKLSKDVADMLSSLSGTVGHSFKSVKTSFATKFKGTDMSNPTFVGKVSESNSRTSLALTASPSSVSKLDGSVDFDIAEVSFNVSPRYNFKNGKGPGVLLSASRGPTSVDVDFEMVKHHVKRKGGKSSTTKKASKAIAMEKNIKEQLKDIDRFNGSSESEGEGDNNGDNNDVNEDDEDWESEHKGLQATSDTDGSAGSDSEDGEEQIEMKGEREGVDVGSDNDLDNDLDNEHGGDSDDDGDGDDLNGKLKGGMGMAGAMSKILASAGALSESSRMKGKESLVLAKTVTKHMKVITKEEREERAMKKKRAERRKKNLKVMYVPTKSGDPMVIESERTLRRVATRGVVALFNAISTHQHEAKLEAEPEDRKSRREKDAKFETKQGFIDKLKTQAEENNEGDEQEDKVETKKVTKKVKETKTEGSKWLQDDFLMKSKLKDWDKGDEASSDDEEIGFVKDGDADLEDAKEYDEKKRKEGEMEEARGRKERKDKSREEANKKRKKGKK
ncbi:hypothetical protein TrRE_jg10104 [Triparma retinervis]|uniref:RRP15-like protein n=1 Tax=Triparma retinervis TaxID=2557542 RepID=A0A9W7CHF6_9STRA|nr:hypothetical protein TrRE_jg10104 [Triparma retinervis]